VRDLEIRKIIITAMKDRGEIDCVIFRQTMKQRPTSLTETEVCTGIDFNPQLLPRNLIDQFPDLLRGQIHVRQADDMLSQLKRNVQLAAKRCVQGEAFFLKPEFNCGAQFKRVLRVLQTHGLEHQAENLQPRCLTPTISDSSCAVGHPCCFPAQQIEIG